MKLERSAKIGNKLCKLTGNTEGVNIQQIQTLLDTAPVMFEEKCGKNVLYYAAKHRKTEVVELLLERRPELSSLWDPTDFLVGEEIDEGDVNKEGAEKEELIRVMHEKTERVLELLIRHDPRFIDQSTDDYYMNIIHHAASEGYHRLVKLILELQPELIDFSGGAEMHTPIQYATMHGGLEVVKCLLELQPELIDSVDEDGAGNLLHYACFKKAKTDVVKLLLQIKPSLIDAVNSDGKIALHIAAANGHGETVKQLIRAKPALINVVDSYCDRTALHWATLRRQEGVVKLLIQAHATIDAVDEEGNAPLYYASSKGASCIVKLLLPQSKLLFEDIIDILTKRFTSKAFELIVEHCKPLTMYLNNDIIHIVYECVIEPSIVKSEFLLRTQQDASELNSNLANSTMLDVKENIERSRPNGKG